MTAMQSPAVQDGAAPQATALDRGIEPPPPRRPTQARLQTRFLRHFMRTGLQAEAAARTGVTARTVRRWRTGNLRFALRYAAAIERRLEALEDRTMQRAFSSERRTLFRRGRPRAVVERYNDPMLMRALGHFDRVRERCQAQTVEKRPFDLSQLTDCELRREMEKRVSRLSPSKGQGNEAASGK